MAIRVTRADLAATLHYSIHFTFRDGERVDELLHSQAALLRWLEAVEGMQAEEEVTISAHMTICHDCPGQPRAEEGPIFMCHMPEWAGPTGGRHG